MNPQSPVILAMGTRPEIIKMAPVALALQRIGIPCEIVHTGQHGDQTSLPLYEFFGLQPRYRVQLERRKSGLGALSAELMEKLSEQFESLMPRAVLVHGDTSSALMAAMAAFYLNIPVGHVEAGLRSGNMREPFPEEMNRTVIGRLARWHFAPTVQAVDNLRHEGICQGVEQVGNTVVDAVQWAAAHLHQLKEQGHALDVPALNWLAESGCDSLVLVTAHRRENWECMASIAQSVQDILSERKELAVVWPLHPNPAVQQSVRSVYGAAPAHIRSRWLLTEPLDYAPMVALMVQADVLLTDSGGIQEEGASLHKPVLVLRNVTERPELIRCGAGKLVGTERATVVRETLCLLQNAAERHAMQEADNPFGDGKAAIRIAERLQSDLVDDPSSSLFTTQQARVQEHNPA